MYRQPVTIHRRSAEPTSYDAHGNPVYGFANFDAWAYRVSPVRGREITIGQQTVVISAAAAFPPDADVKPVDEMTAGATRYKLLSVLPVLCARTPGRTKYLRCDLEAVG